MSASQRNADLYSSEMQEQFDHFAPDWRKHVSRDTNQKSFRAAIVAYWSDLVFRLGLPRARHMELIKGEGNQRLYWLALLSRHPLAHQFWQKISSEAKQPTLPF
jgi:three-Cys-motif partner protein